MDTPEPTKNAKVLYLWSLIDEWASLISLLHILDLDINIRRELENIRRQRPPDKESIAVERTRDTLQKNLNQLRAEIEAAIHVIAGSNHGQL